MREGFPKVRVRVHAQRALVVTGEGQRLIMAAGGSSWLDLALYLIARVMGVEAAMQVARSISSTGTISVNSPLPGSRAHARWRMR